MSYMTSNGLLSTMFIRQKLTMNISIEQVLNYLSLFLLEEKTKYKEIGN